MSRDAYTSINVNQTMSNLGIKPVDPFALLLHVTNSFGTIIQITFSWIYFLSEVAVLVGALVFMVGAIGHHGRIKQVGTRIALYALVGFVAAIILPGVILSINNTLHG
ncbi:MAG: hypothetical protein K6T83_00290 [Alicyclobacillus sp.]|nr:hypothetical protein [Alicyclobacillus sp.]